MEERIFTEDQVKELMVRAFEKGENWGVTYSTWFIPSEEEKAERCAKDCSKSYNDFIENLNQSNNGR